VHLACEQAVDHPDLIDQEHSKYRAGDSGSDSDVISDAGEAISRVGDWKCNRRSHEHHSRDRSDAEYDQVTDGQDWVADCGEYKQGDGGGPGESVNESDDERS